LLGGGGGGGGGGKRTDGQTDGHTDGRDEANFYNFANAPNECNVLDCTLNLPEIRMNTERVILMFTRIIGFIDYYCIKGCFISKSLKIRPRSSRLHCFHDLADMYTLFNKNQAARNFVRPAPKVT